MRHLAKFVLIAVLLAAVGGLPAQESAQTSLRRTIPITVLDRQGKPVGGLATQNLRGEFNGQPVRIVSVKWDARPRRIVVLLDASDSMLWSEKWTLARNGVEDIMLHARPQDQIAVLLFADRIVDRIEFGPTGAAGLARLNVLPGELGEIKKKPTRTALLDSLNEALRLLDPAHLGDLVYVISDGGDNVSKTTPDQITNAFACAGVRSFFLLLLDPDRAGRGSEYGRAPYLVGDIAEKTGGNAASPFFGDREIVGAAARSLYGQMVEFYSVDIELPGPISKRRPWSLKVVDEQGKRIQKIELTYPRQLVPCPVEPSAQR